MLVFEDSDAEILHFGRAIPRDWIASGKPIAIENAPTRYGRVTYRLETRDGGVLSANISLPATGPLPKELHVAFRVPNGKRLGSIAVNGKPGTLGAANRETVVITPEGQRRFEVVAHLD
jgi:hypothetical protein